jgi:hypothetical protein
LIVSRQESRNQSALLGKPDDFLHGAQLCGRPCQAACHRLSVRTPLCEIYGRRYQSWAGSFASLRSRVGPQRIDPPTHGLRPSIKRRGNCLGSAVAESFFSLLKNETVRRRIYRTENVARVDLSDYVDMFYNRKRRCTGDCRSCEERLFRELIVFNVTENAVAREGKKAVNGICRGVAVQG